MSATHLESSLYDTKSPSCVISREARRYILGLQFISLHIYWKMLSLNFHFIWTSFLCNSKYAFTFCFPGNSILWAVRKALDAHFHNYWPSIILWSDSLMQAFEYAVMVNLNVENGGFNILVNFRGSLQYPLWRQVDARLRIEWRLFLGT